MKQHVTIGLVFAVAGSVLTGCGKSPESIVKDAYKSVDEKKFENIAAYVLPDSIEPLNEDEAKNFAEMAALGFWQNDYSSFTVDSVVLNPEKTEARFYVKTNFKNGLSYSETGLLRKTAKGKWRLMADKEATDTADVFSVSDESKRTPELMRNLHYATIMTLASRGLPQYQVKAAQILQDGVLTSSDIERALELLKSAADKNYVPAYKSLGDMYSKGYKKVPKDSEQAFEWYLKAAEAGDVDAYGKVAYAYREGKGTIRDYDKAAEWYEKGVEKDNPACMRGLAYMYNSSLKGFANDYDKAFELLNKGYEIALKSGNISEMRNFANYIGICYYTGEGVEKDVNKEIEWYTKAAEAGDDLAMRNLGATYYFGEGVPKDYDKAFYWFTKSDKAGDIVARYYVGECYEYGRGVDKNTKKAEAIYRELWNEHNDERARRGLHRVW